MKPTLFGHCLWFASIFHIRYIIIIPNYDSIFFKYSLKLKQEGQVSKQPGQFVNYNWHNQLKQRTWTSVNLHLPISQPYKAGRRQESSQHSYFVSTWLTLCIIFCTIPIIYLYLCLKIASQTDLLIFFCLYRVVYRSRVSQKL